MSRPPFQTHFGSPCIHCGVQLEDVAPGPCTGDARKAKVIGYASLGVRYDGVEHYRYRLSTNAVEELYSHVSNHAPYYHFGRREFGQTPPYDARLKARAVPTRATSDADLSPGRSPNPTPPHRPGGET